jgi:hypothetical protein
MPWAAVAFRREADGPFHFTTSDLKIKISALVSLAVVKRERERERERKREGGAISGWRWL